MPPTEIVKTLQDTQLGEIVFRKNRRAKRYIIRVKAETITVTIPYIGTYPFALQFLEKERKTIAEKKQTLALQAKPALPSIDENVLRKQAKQYLPAELDRLAKLYGFTYREVKIRKSKTRWGSCSSKGTINLSLYLMRLPSHLIEYVLLHELCHTRQMNHSPQFWALLDNFTGGKSKLLRKEIRQYSIPK
ncbi:zinc protease [Bacteroidia bacterium]|nr:zinc protease [Bacteroidia bacterium]